MPTATIDGLRINYTRAGPAEPHNRLLYVHGTGCNAEVWRRHMEAMSDRFDCAAIDLPGHGLSEGKGFRGAADYAHFVNALAVELGWDEYVLVGHSLGGAIVQIVATYHPTRLSGLILVDTGARLRVAPEILEYARRVAAGEQPEPRDPRWTYAESTPDAVIDQVNQDLGTVDPDLVYRDWIADDTFDFFARVKNIDVRTLAIGGDEDPITPVRNHVYFHTEMPDCELAIIERCGHWPNYEQPEQFDALVRRFCNV